MLRGSTLDNGTDIKEYFNTMENEGQVRINYTGINEVCRDILTATLKVNPEERATIHKIKYIIDKSMIAVMQEKLNNGNKNMHHANKPSNNKSVNINISTSNKNHNNNSNSSSKNASHNASKNASKNNSQNIKKETISSTNSFSSVRYEPRMISDGHILHNAPRKPPQH